MNVNLTWRRNRKALAEEQEPVLYSDNASELYKAVMLASLSEGADRGNHRFRAERSFLLVEIQKNDPSFVAKLAVYMLEEMHCRDLAYFLSASFVVLSGKNVEAIALVDRMLEQAAGLPEWMENYVNTFQEYHGKKFRRPGRQLIKILSPVFNRLDEFQYTRYSREQQARIRRTLIQVKPSARDRAQRELFAKILKDQLPARTTWYEELEGIRKLHYDSSALKRAALKNKWGELILSWKVSYNDLLDQLPVILQVGLGGKAIQLLAQYLGNAGAVAKNGHLPFRYLEVYRKVKALGHYQGPLILEALEKAAILSAGNIPGFQADTRVLVAMDVSNSMKHPVQEGSRTDRFDIAPLLGMSLSYRCNRLTTGLFGNTWKPVSLAGKEMLLELEAFQKREGEVGFAANGYEVIRELIRREQVTDKVLLFTDCKLWDHRQPNQSAGTDIGRLWRQYKQVAPHARLYLFDLAAYGDNPLEVLPDDVFLVAGWNERIFAALDGIEKNG